MTYSSLVEAFEVLNARKREDPDGLSAENLGRWKQMRNEIEQALFQHAPDPANDRRDHLRVPVSLAVRYWTSNELKDRYIPELGEGGLFIQTENPLPVGYKVDLEISLVKKKFSLGVKGEVVWTGKGDNPARRGMGVRFVDLTYEQKTVIYNLVCDGMRENLLERRRFARLDSRLPAQFLYPEGTYQLPTNDLGLGGVFVVTDHLALEGEQVRVRLGVPGISPPLQMAARVIRVVQEPLPGLPAGIGLGFVKMDAQRNKTILEYMVRRVTGRLRPPGTAHGKRRHSRLKRRIPVEFHFLGLKGTSFCRDISNGGVFIQTHEPPPVGAGIDVVVEHPTTRRNLPLAGEVVRVVDPDPSHPHEVPGAGVVFMNVGGEKDRCLRKLLRDSVLVGLPLRRVVADGDHAARTDRGRPGMGA